jgi:sugar phosphate isomerase/epimerase
MTHPRLSINALSSYRWSFDEDLALWSELGVAWAGLIGAKCGEDLDGGLARMAAAGIRASTVIAAGFNLAQPETWDDTRASLNATLDTVAKHHGWSVYITPGRTTFAPWGEVLEVFAEASAPCVAHAGMAGVRLAFEPSQRPDVSFINTVRDGIDASVRTGMGLVVDFGNCWMERDFRETVIAAAPHIALVQVGDTPVTGPMAPGPASGAGRVPFGEGNLPIERMLRDVKDSGYPGPLELELPGPLGETEGYANVIRRGAERASAMFEKVGL